MTKKKIGNPLAGRGVPFFIHSSLKLSLWLFNQKSKGRWGKAQIDWGIFTWADLKCTPFSDRVDFNLVILLMFA